MLVLGLDVSTAKIGVALLNDKDIVFLDLIKFPKNVSLYEKINIVKSFLSSIKKQYSNIEKICIEEPMMMFSSAMSMAQTISLLQRWNGMVSCLVYEIFCMEPILINVNSARKIVGIKIDRKKKYKNTREKKEPIINYMIDYYKDSKTPITIEYNRNMNYKDGFDDKIDALVIALSNS